MQVASRMASVVTGASFGASDFHNMRLQLVGDAVAALVVLLIATVLSVFKPQGLTPFGRNQSFRPDTLEQPGVPRWVRVSGISLFVALVAFVLIKHLSSGGLSHHMQ